MPDVLRYSDEAARAGYLAGFNAAQAFIFVRRGRRIAKTHRGGRTAFAELTLGDARLGRKFARFPAVGYRSEESVDNRAGDAAVTAEGARELTGAAALSIDTIAEILAQEVP